MSTLILAGLGPPFAAAATTLNIVAIGDSYTAGNGAGKYIDTGCYRSPENWSSKYAAMRRAGGQAVHYENWACSGSTTSTYAYGVNTNPYGAVSTSPGGVQAGHVTRSADLVVMTFGGNDIGFSDLVFQCHIQRDYNECSKALVKAKAMLDDRGSDGMSARLRTVLTDVRNRVRNDTMIVLMGYPALVRDKCGDSIRKPTNPLTELHVADRFREIAATADAVEAQVISDLRASTGNANAQFIKVSDTFKEHGPGEPLHYVSPTGNCTSNSDTWIVEVGGSTVTTQLNTYYHPNPSGQAEYAYLLLERLPSWLPRATTTTSPPPAATNQAPTALFSYARLAGSGNRVRLNGQSSRDPDGTLARWEWVVGSTVIGTGSSLDHAFGSVTSPAVTLRVTDNAGTSSQLTRTLSLPNRGPVITSASPAEGAVIGTNQPRLQVGASDADGDQLTYKYRVTGPQVDLSSPATGAVWTVPAHSLDPGQTYAWSATVTDSRGQSSTLTRRLVIATLPTASDMISTASGNGYWQVASDGGVFSYGDATFFGSVPALGLRLSSIMGMARTPTGKGYWLVGSDGGVFSFGDAGFFGSLPGQGIALSNVVGMVPTKTGGGYWLVAADGGVFSFGDAAFYGSMGGRPLNAPMVGISATASGQGYWLVGADGGIFSFGDAAFFGSMGGRPLNSPVTDIDVTFDGQGYWLTAEDGGVFTFGDAGFYGSMGGQPLNGHVTGMAATPSGAGYWLTGCDGGVFSFGDAQFRGSNPTYQCRGTR